VKMAQCPERTALYDTHVALAAKMAPFGGYMMPIQYEGIIKEHSATRSSSALFDTCHMGEILVSGDSALDDLEKIVSCDLATLFAGQCRYGFMCNEQGGVIDDLLVYRMSDTSFMLVVNAGTRNSDFEWVTSHLSDSTRAEDLSASTAKVDLQGPASPRIMQALIPEGIADLKFYRFKHATYGGRKALVSRTGYTGEIGFELYCTPKSAAVFWNECVAMGASPAGLGARDTLRLEIGMPLYGHELDATRNAAESGFARAISATKSFIGSGVVLDSSRNTASLVGLEFDGRRTARHGDAIEDTDGNRVGTVTSGSFSPSLGKAIALGYIDNAMLANETPLAVRAARGVLAAAVVRAPFYKDGTARRRIADFLVDESAAQQLKSP